jgi:hypothetical protein
MGLGGAAAATKAGLPVVRSDPSAGHLAQVRPSVLRQPAKDLRSRAMRDGALAGRRAKLSQGLAPLPAAKAAPGHVDAHAASASWPSRTASALRLWSLHGCGCDHRRRVGNHGSGMGLFRAGLRPVRTGRGCIAALATIAGCDARDPFG